MKHKKLLAMIGLVLLSLHVVGLVIQSYQYASFVDVFDNVFFMVILLTSFLGSIISTLFYIYYMIWFLGYQKQDHQINKLFIVTLVAYGIAVVLSVLRFATIDIAVGGIVGVLITLVTGMFVPGAIYMWRKKEYTGVYVFLGLHEVVILFSVASNIAGSIVGLGPFYSGFLIGLVTVTIVFPQIIFIALVAMHVYYESREMNTVEEIKEVEHDELYL
jgi:hypothetical protein